MELNKESLEKLLIRIDEGFSDTDIGFHQRPIHAFGNLAQLIDPDAEYALKLDDQIRIDDYSDGALFTQVHRWYEKRYGDRLKIHMGPGSYILMIKNEPWEVVYPLCLGRSNFTINNDLNTSDTSHVVISGQPVPEVNILCHVENMTTEVAKSLSRDEQKYLLSEYMFGLEGVQMLRNLGGSPFMLQAANDYDVSVSNIFHKYPDNNNSKWAALQFTEKSMKSKLAMSNVEFERNHNLTSLAESLIHLGINIPTHTIDRIQCSPGVRYGEVRVSRKEAIEAVQAAMDLFSTIYC